MVIYLPLVYIQKNNILFRIRKSLFMKDILKYIGTILGIIFLLIIVIDFATYTWPNEPDSITLLFYKNRYWVFLFSVICAIIIKAKAVISFYLVVLPIISFVFTAIYDGIFTHTLPFKKDTYTFKWWCMIWEYKIYIAIGLIGMIVLESLIKKLIDYIEYRRSIPKASKKEVVYKTNTKSLSPLPNNASGYKQIYNNLSSNIKEELNTRITNIVKELKKANFKHKDIRERVEKSKEQILEVNKELSNKISDLKNVHEWNKYTIAFFGETNAGKSTVIEALRISLKEKLKAKEYQKFEKIVAKKEILDTTIIKIKAKRDFYKDKNKLLYGILLLFINLKYWLLQNKERRILKKLAKFKDGEIIGTGIQDFTQSCIDYNFSHNGREYTLIDVPGIEGNEGKYEDMILQAVSRAHTVFYVVSGKIPESGTVQKIKKYLRQQAEVYCVINERKNKYFPEDAQKTFRELHYNQQFTQDVNQKMQEVLGDFYKGSVTIQALLAFYGVSKTIPYSKNEKYIKNRNKFLTVFNKEENLLEKSNLSSVANLILTELNNVDIKIYNINIDKIIACIDFFSLKMEEVRDGSYSDHLLDEIGKQVNNANNSISKAPNSLMNNLKVSESSIINSAFIECEQEINDYVEKNEIRKDTFKYFCESIIEKAINKILESYKEEVERYARSETDRINNELKRLGDRVNSLQTSFSSINMSNQLQIEIPSINFKEVISFVGGVAAWVSGGALLGSFIPGVGNAVGAIIGGIVGLIMQGIKALFGGESKKAKIRRKVSEELRKLKIEVTQKIGELKYQIVTQFENDIVLPIIEQNKQMVIRYKSLQNLFNENINFLNTQKNNLENEKRHY